MLKQMLTQKNKVHSASKVEPIVLLSARSMRWGGFEAITDYKERFDSALAEYQEQKNVQLEDSDIKLDFFSGFDNMRYTEFKTTLDHVENPNSKRSGKS